jgi:hypothetical protein
LYPDKNEIPLSDTIIKLEPVLSRSKHLQTVPPGTGRHPNPAQRLSATRTERVEVWWHRLRGKDDPTLKIGASNKLDTVEGEYVWALRDINLEVKQGLILGIIDRN